MNQPALTQTLEREGRAATVPAPSHRTVGGRGARAPHSLRGAALRRAIPRIPASPGIAPSQPAGNRPSPFSLDATSVHLTDQAKYRYHTDAGKAYVLLAESSSKEIVVPEALGGAPVTAISRGAFSDLAALERIALPDSLTTIGQEAFARCANLRDVQLGNSLEVIGEGAFRGCSHLGRLDLPKSLTTIGDSAFSNTSLSRLAIPSACKNIGDDALCTGPSFPGSTGLAYASSLSEISVAPGNRTFTMHGGVLCRALPDGRLDAVFCPGSIGEVMLDERVRSVAPATFAGTRHIAHLLVSERLSFPENTPPLPNRACDRLTIEFAMPRGAYREISLEMPSGAVRGSIIDAAFFAGRIRPEALSSAYDNSLPQVKDEFEQTRLMAARLARPVLLDEAHEALFRSVVDKSFVSLCVHAGARNDWGTLDNLMESGILDGERTPEAVSALNRFGFTLAAARVIDGKEERFGNQCVDYGI